MKLNSTSTQIDCPIVSTPATQAEDLSDDCESLIEIVARLDIQRDWFIDQDQEHPPARQHPVESLVALFLYKHARKLSSLELIDRLIARGEISHFDLPHVPSQQLLSYVWRYEFEHSDRVVIWSAALQIRCIHDFD